jgi:hypothetical protein
MTRIAIFLVLALNVIPASAGRCEDFPIYSVHDMDGTQHSIVISGDKVKKAPTWKPGSGEPPIGLSAAVSSALAWAKQTYIRFDDVVIEYIEIRRYGCSSEDHWYYVVKFAPVIEGSSVRGIGYFAAVLMDGSVVGPQKRKGSL